MSDKASLAKDLITSLQEGGRFYEEVVRADLFPELADLLHRMVKLRDRAALHIATIPEPGELVVAPPGSFQPMLHELSANLKSLVGDRRQAYLSELVELEKRTVEQLAAAKQAFDSAEDKAVMDEIIAEFRDNVAILTSATQARD